MEKGKLLGLPAPSLSSSPKPRYEPIIIDYIKPTLVADHSHIELRVMAQQLIRLAKEGK